MRTLSGQSGSALVEAAILFPCLVLILFWSIAFTDVLILKLKASEAARFALWETTAGPEHPMVALTLDKMATFYSVQKRFDEAVALAERAAGRAFRPIAAGPRRSRRCLGW